MPFTIRPKERKTFYLDNPRTTVVALDALHKALNDRQTKTTPTWFGLGNDMRGPRSSRIGNAPLERIGVLLELEGFDTISATKYTLKDGRKYASVVVLGKKGKFKDFEAFMLDMLGEGGKPGKCVYGMSELHNPTGPSDLIGRDKKQELYSIFFRIPDDGFPGFKNSSLSNSEDLQIAKE